MINLEEVGAHVCAVNRRGIEVQFGLYLPGIEAKDGYEVKLFVLPKADHYIPTIVPREFVLKQTGGSDYNLWQARIAIKTEKGTHFGLPGTYLYRYQLLRTEPGTNNKQVVVRWFTDPFAQATDIGLLSAFATPGSEPRFSWTDRNWRTPDLEKLVIYELNVAEFNSTFDGVAERIPYLQSLGVTCLELMPITSLKLNFDWGYAPLHYFAPYQRWGGVAGLKRLVDACHSAGLAVILDVVYQHVDPTFPYNLLYKTTGIESPMIGEDGMFGPMIDYTRDFAREYIQTVNFYWLHEYHIDGFRYDEVTDLYDGPLGIQYARIAYETYNESLHIPRFLPAGRARPGEYSRIIQITEAQNRPQEVLRNTYTTGTWQDVLRTMSEGMAHNGTVDENFVPQVILYPGFAGYSNTKTVHDITGKPVEMPVAPCQYLENHDNSELITHISTIGDDVPSGDRRFSYKLQPFAIALYTCEGIPMLWQGQEFAENYVLPNEGLARISYLRNVRWEFFYDEFGGPLIRLYRTLGELRRRCPALRSRESFYYRDESRIEDKIVAYRRQSSATGQIAMIFLNFSGSPQTIEVPFPEPGTYREMIDDSVHTRPYTIVVREANQRMSVEVPSHYGYIFLK